MRQLALRVLRLLGLDLRAPRVIEVNVAFQAPRIREMVIY